MLFLTKTILNILLIFLCRLAFVLLENEDCTFCRRDDLGVFYSLPNTAWQAISPFDLNVTYLMPFVEMIATEFKIVHAVISFHDSMNKHRNKIIDIYTQLPLLAMSQYNANIFRTNQTKFIEVWVSFSTKGKLISDDQLETVREIVENVNSVYAHTVTKIVYMQSSFIGFQTQTNALSNETWNMYKLRSTFPPKNFRLSYMPKSRSGHSCETLRLADSLMFELRGGFKEFVISGWKKHTMIDFVWEAHQRLHKQCNQTWKVEIMSNFGDTQSDYKTQYNLMVEIWKSFADITLVQNIYLIHGSAFDAYKLNSVARATSGWWHVSENRNNQLDFVSKQMLAENEQNLRATPKYKLTESYDFSKSNTVCVYFNNPFKKSNIPLRNQNDHLLLKAVLNKAFTRFRCILYDTQIINLNYSDQQNVQVLVDSNNDLSVQASLINHLSREGALPSLNFTQVLIEYPASDQQIIQLKKELAYTPSEERVKVGTRLDILDACSQTSSIRLLNLLDFLYIQHVPGFSILKGYLFGLDRIIPDTLVVFEKCKRKLNRLMPHLQIGFITGYPDTYKSNKDDYASLVIFWQEVAQWAQETNTTVIMINSLDYSELMGNDTTTSMSVVNMPHMGWWKAKLVNNNWRLLEKREVALAKIGKKTVITKETSQKQTMVLSTVIPLLVLLVGVLVAFYVYQKKTKMSNLKRYVEDNDICQDFAQVLPATGFVKAASTLIGSGNFGSVYKCYMQQFEGHVAVKVATTEEQASMEHAITCLISEIKVMSRIGRHKNILSMLGMCVEGDLFMVTEYCENGSLITYLRSHGKLQAYELYKFCFEITAGLNFLHKNDIIHGDLSTRNILLTSDYNCKISDFGLARQLEACKIYSKQGGEPLPWRWMAIESLERLEFSPMSDVWSLGVTFWEVFTLGKLPFVDMTYTDDFIQQLVNGLRLKEPKLCGKCMYELMLSCWNILPAERTNTEAASKKLADLMKKEYVCF